MLLDPRAPKTLADFVEAWPHLRQVGSEWVGPCPSCGGTDRFHVRSGSGATFGCRTCIDGEDDETKRTAKKTIIGILWSKGPSIRRRRQAKHKAAPPPPEPPAPTQPSSQRYGQRLWAQARPAAPGPVRRWLAERHLLHPLATMPECIRWHDEGFLVAALWGLDALKEAWPALPSSVPVAVHCVGIDEAGGKARRWGERDKTSLGPLSAAVLALGNPTTSEPTRIVEGLADALAVYSRCEGLVLAALTTVQVIVSRPGVLEHLRQAGSAHLHGDEGPAGQAAMNELVAALAAAGVKSLLYPDSEYDDPAERAAAHPWPDVDRYYFDEASGKQLSDGTLPLAEADRMAILSLTKEGPLK